MAEVAGSQMLGRAWGAGRAAIPELRRLLEDEHQLVQRSAAESLTKIEAAA